MATIAEIAKRAGVSSGTVFNVIHQRSVSDARRDQVLRVMDDLKYRPKTRPRRARIKGSPMLDTVRLVIVGRTVQDVSRHPVYLKLLHGVERACEAAGLACQLHAQPDPDLARLPEPGRRDGMIVLHLTSAKWSDRPVDRSRVVSVLGEPSGRFDFVSFDREAVTAMAADWLIGRGVRSAAVVAVKEAHRAQSFLSHFRARGGEASHITFPWLDVEELRAGLERAFTSRQPPQGLFLYSDEIAMHAHKILQDLGLEPQRDVQLIGCNNDDPYRVGLRPHVPATIDIHLEAVGQSAVTLLLDRAAHPDRPIRHLTIQPSLQE